MTDNSWKITWDRWNPDEEPLREALSTLSNGYIATRGAMECNHARKPHYPGTYMAGGYNRATSEVEDRKIVNEDLVNFPNWLYLNFRPKNGEWFSLERVEVLEYTQELDLKQGVLVRKILFRDGANQETELKTRRLISMADKHVMGIHWELTPLNWSGEIVLHTAIDGSVTNSGVERYRALEGQHLETLETGMVGEDGISLLTRTRQSQVRLAMAARTRLYNGSKAWPAERHTEKRGKDYIFQEISLKLSEKEPLHVEKMVSVYNSKDFAITEPLTEAKNCLSRLSGFNDHIKLHADAWHRIWKRADMVVEGEHEVQQILRFHIFHLLQTVTPNSIDLDIGVPSRGWHGEAYRGHIFWDEIFILPYLALHMPNLCRELILYRFRRLKEARFAAKDAGLEGAMFPWQSGSNGREESQIIHLNPKSGKWVPDTTYRQRHINAAIVYNTWHYYQASRDMQFMVNYGAELVLDIARFWSSIAQFNADRDRYEIHNVVGPDEFKTGYPGKEGGLNNNAYTNIMAVWCIKKALQILQELSNSKEHELLHLLDISHEERIRWEEIIQKMYVPFINDNIISQFDGYEDLEEFPWDEYRKKYGDIQRLDRILGNEGKDINKYKVSKQADVLMLFYLFTADELEELLHGLNYKNFTRKSMQDNIEYYDKRTSHGSTLSRIVYSWVMARSDRERSWEFFRDALTSDIHDIQGGTTPEGIHLGAMAGTIDIVQRCFTGFNIRHGVLEFNPYLPGRITKLVTRLCYNNTWLRMELSQTKMKLSFERGYQQELKIRIINDYHTLKIGEEKEFKLNGGRLENAE